MSVLRHVPVVMITALDDLDSAVRCIGLGADDYLAKPFDPILLGARVRAGLNKKRLHDLEPRAHGGLEYRLNQRLVARVEEQQAELVRTGELRRFLPQQVAQGLLLDGELDEDERPRRVTLLFTDMVGFTRPLRQPGARGAVGRPERVPAGVYSPGREARRGRSTTSSATG